MGWLSLVIEVITLALKYGPDLVALVKEILAHLRHVQDPGTKSSFAAELETLAGAFALTQDKRPLLDLLRRVAEAAQS